MLYRAKSMACAIKTRKSATHKRRYVLHITLNNEPVFRVHGERKINSTDNSERQPTAATQNVAELVDCASTPLHMRIEYAAQLAGLSPNARAADKYLCLLERGPPSKYMQMRAAFATIGSHPTRTVQGV